MAKKNPAEVIQSYRESRLSRTKFTFAFTSQIVLLLIILASTIYIAVTGGPALPTIVDLKTNTPTYTPSITPTPTQTATITATLTNTPDPESQCDCTPVEVTVIVVITATFSNTNTPESQPTSTITQIPTIAHTQTITNTPTNTFTPTSTYTPRPSETPTPTQTIHTVRYGETLGSIALKYGVTVEAIQAANNLNTTLIIEGQQLQIPRP